MIAGRKPAGRPTEQTFEISFGRELTEHDVGLPKAGAQAAGGILQRLRHRHHTAARGFAAGLTRREVEVMTGYSNSRLDSLQTDPAFMELIAQYQNEIGDRVVDAAVEFQTKLIDLARDSVGEIQDRLDDDELRAKIPIGELRQLAAFGLDRTVAPPKTAQPQAPVPTKITFNMGSKTLTVEDDADSGPEILTIEASTPTIIDGTALEIKETDSDKGDKEEPEPSG